jgi:hypothetical protein
LIDLCVKLLLAFDKTIRSYISYFAGQTCKSVAEMFINVIEALIYKMFWGEKTPKEG